MQSDPTIAALSKQKMLYIAAVIRKLSCSLLEPIRLQPTRRTRRVLGEYTADECQRLPTYLVFGSRDINGRPKQNAAGTRRCALSTDFGTTNLFRYCGMYFFWAIFSSVRIAKNDESPTFRVRCPNNAPQFFPLRVACDLCLLRSKHFVLKK